MSWELAETRKFTMTAIEFTAFGRLESEGRLLKPAHKAPTKSCGTFWISRRNRCFARPAGESRGGLRRGPGWGDGLVLSRRIARILQAASRAGRNARRQRRARGKYFIYVSDLDRASRYQIGFNDVSLYVLPIDDTSVYNELIDFLYLDKTKMKKYDTAEKIDVIVDGAEKYDQAYEAISYEEGLKRLGL